MGIRNQPVYWKSSFLAKCLSLFLCKYKSLAPAIQTANCITLAKLKQKKKDEEEYDLLYQMGAILPCVVAESSASNIFLGKLEAWSPHCRTSHWFLRPVNISYTIDTDYPDCLF